MTQPVSVSTSSTSSYFVYFFQEFYREVLIQRELALRSMEPVEEVPVGKNNDGQEGAEAAAPLVQTMEEEQSKLEAEIVPGPKVEGAELETARVEDVEIERAEREREYAFQDKQRAEKEILCDKIQQKFIVLFDKFSSQAQYQPGEFAGAYFQDLLYAMVAMLDEVFLAFAWHGQRRWKHNLMEKRYFHTQIAGELFFKKVEDLIQTNDSTRLDLAEVYLMILALGFKGQYRGEDDEGQLRWYRQQLYALIHKHSSTLFHPGRERLIEESYDHTISFEVIKGLPHLKNWMIAFSSIVIVYIIISSFLWHGVVRDLNDVIGQIMFQAQSLGLS